MMYEITVEPRLLKSKGNVKVLGVSSGLPVLN